MIEDIPNFKEIYSYKKELNILNSEIYGCNNLLKDNIETIIDLLKSDNYIENDKVSIKGVIAMGINECQELVFTEMIFKGLLDNLNFPEIAAILSSFINEKDQSSEEKYITDLKVPKKVTDVLKNILKISEYFIQLEENKKLYINSDYKLYLDFIEPSYIWASGGSINEVYQTTNVYDGNFVKSIMRLNNICENLMDICKTIERFDICSKLEGYNQILIRDITSINSLYIS